MDTLPFAVVGVTLFATDRVTAHSAIPSGVLAELIGITTEHVVVYFTFRTGEPYGFAFPVERIDWEFTLDLYIGSHLYVGYIGCDPKLV